MVQMQRPTWLKVALACLSGWLAFLFSFFLYAIGLAVAARAVLKPDGIKGLYGLVYLVVCVLAAVATGALVARWQQRLLAHRSLKVNYIVFAVLLILAVLFVPTPFTYLAAE